MSFVCFYKYSFSQKRTTFDPDSNVQMISAHTSVLERNSMPKDSFHKMQYKNTRGWVSVKEDRVIMFFGYLYSFNEPGQMYCMCGVTFVIKIDIKDSVLQMVLVVDQDIWPILTELHHCSPSHDRFSLWKRLSIPAKNVSRQIY